MGQLSESMLQNQVETTKVGDDTDAEALQKILDGLEGVGPVVPESGPVDVTSLEAVQPQTGAVVIDPESLVDVPPLQWPEAIQ